MNKELELVTALTEATTQGTVRWRRLESTGILFVSQRFLGTLRSGRTFVLDVTSPTITGETAFRLEIRDEDDDVESSIQASTADEDLAGAFAELCQLVTRRFETPIDKALKELKASRSA
jgi:hypothetical protein